MDRRGPVLILTASVGAGHLVAARAVADALRARLPEREIDVIDVLQRSTRLFRTIYARGYIEMVNRLPSLMGYLYRTTDGPCDGLGERARVMFQNFSNRAFERELIRRRPLLIINTHFLPAEIDTSGLSKEIREAKLEVENAAQETFVAAQDRLATAQTKERVARKG